MGLEKPKAKLFGSKRRLRMLPFYCGKQWKWRLWCRFH